MMLYIFEPNRIPIKGMFCIFLLLFSVCTIQAQEGSGDILTSRLNDIRTALDTAIFVNRFQSVETPCVYIDSVNDRYAKPERDIVNSNYRIILDKNKNIDSNGVRCLSQFCSRYMRFTVDSNSVDIANQTIKGKVALTYAYPVSSLVQYLGFTIRRSDKTKVYFDKLLHSNGTFTMFPESNKYRIRIKLNSAPYNNNYTIDGYLEIVQSAYKPSNDKAFNFFFDNMSIKKGDSTNQIFLKFTSTSHNNEMMYFSNMFYNAIKLKDSPAMEERANAIWINNFITNEKCIPCKPLNIMVQTILRANKFSLPNTEPIPAH